MDFSQFASSGIRSLQKAASTLQSPRLVTAAVLGAMLVMQAPTAAEAKSRSSSSRSSSHVSSHMSRSLSTNNIILYSAMMNSHGYSGDIETVEKGVKEVYDVARDILKGYDDQKSIFEYDDVPLEKDINLISDVLDSPFLLDDLIELTIIHNVGDDFDYATATNELKDDLRMQVRNALLVQHMVNTFNDDSVPGHLVDGVFSVGYAMDMGDIMESDPTSSFGEGIIALTSGVRDASYQAAVDTVDNGGYLTRQEYDYALLGLTALQSKADQRVSVKVSIGDEGIATEITDNPYGIVKELKKLVKGTTDLMGNQHGGTDADFDYYAIVRSLVAAQKDQTVTMNLTKNEQDFIPFNGVPDYGQVTFEVISPEYTEDLSMKSMR